ncbi:NTF2-like protein [Metschnikowia bicuspidata]|uniref:NTF2-like protein n=1 Tax=Metschnikowia bicuspidata TaxID=27322 RepID=A0A4P9ZB97_9ASCO|nr:NTF2-like protein [Metschnikowia bicuspidata]
MIGSDPSVPIEPFLKSLLSSLDLQLHHSGTATQPRFQSVEDYATQFGRQLKSTSAIVVNGHPLAPQPPTNDARLEFQKKWLACPNSKHTLTSFDCHLIPGTGLYTILVNGKVSFDESGCSRLGVTADVPQNPQMQPGRAIWGPGFGFCLAMVVDEAVAASANAQVINSFDYRLVYKPHDILVEI